jgi:hypothetical protein
MVEMVKSWFITHELASTETNRDIRVRCWDIFAIFVECKLDRELTLFAK